MKPYVFFFGLIFVCAPAILALEPFELPPMGTHLRYEHQNQKSQQNTGYSELSYDRTDSGMREERLLNRKPTGEIFQEKTSRFDEQGNLMFYHEVNHRTGLSITDRVVKNNLITKLQRSQKKKELHRPLGEGLVPFEVLTLYLAAHLEELGQGETLTFTLYLPLLGLDYEEFTEIQVRAQKTGASLLNGPRGKERGISILVTPANALLRMLMPAEKSQFRFTYLTKKPVLLYQFSESQTRSTLVQLDFP